MTDEALCFDMYGTLCDTGSVATRLGDVLGVTSDLVGDIDRLWRQKQLQYSYHRGQMEAYDPFWEVTADALDYALAFYDVETDADERERVLDAYNHLDAFAGAREALTALDDAGYTCVVLSNGTPEMLETLADNAGLRDHLDGIVSAHEVRTFKPAPAVYENAADRLDRGLDACRLISSNAWDVAGASNADMRTAWINRKREPRERLGEHADVEVRSLTALPDALS
jgi:2-haloacid dehalogenase